MNARIYGRFSSKPQEHGDSKRRQIDGANKYAAHNGYVIMGTPYFDAGVSGKAGANLRKELGRLLAEAQDGETILFESMERLGRQHPFELTHMIYQAVERGITFNAYDEGKIIDKDNIKDLGDMFAVFTGAATGYVENQRKMAKLLAVNETSFKQAAAGVPSANFKKYLPLAFVWDEKKKAIVHDEAKAAIVRRIFDEYNAGTGRTTICKRLNQDKVPTLYAKNKSKAWLETSLKKILRNEAYAGVANVKGYRITCFPAIVSRDVFDKAQLLLKRNRSRHGRTGDKSRINNIFGNLAFCETCNGKVAVNKTAAHKKRNKPSYSFKCRNHKIGKCKCHSMRNVSPIEVLALGTFFGGAGETILAKDGRKLQEKRDALEHRLATVEKHMANLLGLVAEGDKDAKRLRDERRAERDAIQQELSTLAGEITEKSHAPEMLSELRDLLNLNPVKAVAAVKNHFVNIRAKLENNDTRRKLCVMMPSLIQGLVINLPENEFHIIRKDGTKTDKIKVFDTIDAIRKKGFSF